MQGLQDFLPGFPVQFYLFLLKVFDKNGRIVYSKKGYNNEWDGSFNGNFLATDTYYYIIDFGTTISPVKGYITIVRN